MTENTTRPKPKPGLFKDPTHLLMRDEDDIGSVISDVDLRVLVDSLCRDVRHHVELFPLYDAKVDGKMEGINSTISALSFHYCCIAVRTCAGEQYCERSNYDHARLFYGGDTPMRVSDMEVRVTENIKHYMERTFPVAIYYNCETPAPEFVRWKDGAEGGYVKYYCPILGLWEMMFPVVVRGLVLGVVLRGQIPNIDETSRKIREAFVGKTNLFSDYFAKHHEYDDVTLKKTLLDGKNLHIPENIIKYDIDESRGIWAESWHTAEDYNEPVEAFLTRIQEALTDLTRSLEDSMRKIRRRYIARVVRDTSLSFYRDVLSSNTALPGGKEARPLSAGSSLLDEFGILPYWHGVEELLRTLVDKLDLRDMQVFGAYNPQSDFEDITDLELVAFYSRYGYRADDLREIRWVLRFRIYEEDKGYSRRILSSKPFTCDMSVEVDEKLDERIAVVTDGKTASAAHEHSVFMNVLYYPVPDNWLHSSALVINYEKREGEAYDFIIEAILEELSLFSTQIFHSSSYLLDNLLQSNTTRTLRFFNHELSHLLLGYNFLNETYIKNFEYYAALSPKERGDVELDFTGTEEMMRSISNNIQILTKPKEDIRLNLEYFRIFKELLWKWESLFRREAVDRNLQFVIPKMIHLDDDNRPVIYSDKRLLEQIVYNLVHNAIKYSHWGTNIGIDCRLVYEKAIHGQVLSVTDYGAEIETDRRPYQLYYRNPDTKQFIEGSGIGLFVAARIANILGISVNHRCLPISKYNVGLIDAYLNTPFRSIQKDSGLVAELQAEKVRLGGTMQKMVCGYAPIEPLPEKDIADMIRLPTYKVIFEVRL